MTSLLLPIAALLAGVALLLFGSGLLGTLLAVRADGEGYTAQTTGLIMSGYFVGFLLGTFLAPPLIRRIGHIRAFAFYAAAAAALVLLHALIVEPLVWFALRVATGISLVGLYNVIESWLGAHAPPERRGQVFAVYMTVNLLALAAGQQLLRLYDPSAFALFAIVAMLVSAAVMPVTWTRLTQPQVPHAQRLGVRAMYREAPAAAAGAFLSGLGMSAFWGVGPLFAQRADLGADGVATFMTVVILGGGLLQWPLGRLSDRLDRRLALAISAGLAALTALVALALVGGDRRWLYVAFFVWGGIAFTLYPISVAHLMDRLSQEQMLSGSSTLLLVHGAGAAIGPALAGTLIGGIGAAGLPAYFGLAFALLALFAFWRWWSGRPPAPQPAHFHPMVRTTPAALELLPETDAAPAPTATATATAK